MLVIIPSLNEEAYIVKTLESIANQRTNFDYGVIVCDGGSTDKTVRIAKKYAKVVICPIRNKATQMNYAADKAKGGILVFIDADTILPENYLQRMYELFKNDDGLLACGTWFKFLEKGLKIKFAELCMNFYLGFFKNLLGSPELSGSNLCVRRDAFYEIGGFKDVPSEDTELSIALRKLARGKKAGKIRYTRNPKVLVSARRIEKMGFINSFVYNIQNERKTAALRENPECRD
jgi:cellulose synthase/poly-beta-1,6-N-acetylglucosamine synthase-like glycosyltransferase